MCQIILQTVLETGRREDTRINWRLWISNVALCLRIIPRWTVRRVRVLTTRRNLAQRRFLCFPPSCLNYHFARYSVTKSIATQNAYIGIVLDHDTKNLNAASLEETVAWICVTAMCLCVFVFVLSFLRLFDEKWSGWLWCNFHLSLNTCVVVLLYSRYLEDMLHLFEFMF